MLDRPHYLQNSMTGAIDEFPSWGEAFDTMVRRNKREHWSLSMSRPEPFEPKSTEPFIVTPISGPGIGSYERAAHCAAEIGRQIAERQAALSLQAAE